VLHEDQPNIFNVPLQNPSRMIYHITTEKEWAAAEGKNDYAPAAFAKDGFVHTARINQLEGVWERYYSGKTNLLLLCIDERKLDANLVYEPSTNRELYPHVYGTINKNSIVRLVEDFDQEKLSLVKSER
jgi:uncharacterized protein (DUF952 family)